MSEMHADDLSSAEARRDGDELVGATLAVERALRWWPRLLGEPRLRELTVCCDLGGNDDEFTALAGEIAVRGLPPALQRLELDRRRHWADRAIDVLELDPTRTWLSLQIDDPTDTAPMLAALATMLTRAAGLTTLELSSSARGRNDLDPLLAAVIAAGPWPSLQSLALACDRASERDWVQWLATRRLSELLAGCPALTSLSLPRAELWLDALTHPALRELELGWLGATPLGPSDSREWGRGPTPRGSGLEFLRAARLPALERLAIDFQYDWYVGWQVADIAALCEARGMPRLTRLEARYCDLGDELLRRLPDAPWAGQLERLELPGTEFDGDTVATLIAARPRLARLSELWCFQPHDLDDAAWSALCAAYRVCTPD